MESSCRDFGSRCRRLLHWGPLIALSIIFYVAGYTSLVIFTEWPPSDSAWRLLHACLYAAEFYLVMLTFLRAAFWGPGFVPLGWRPAVQPPQVDSALQWCSACKGYKAPRSHHCRRCGRCVMKMDHHCPWINTCVGHLNHAQFTYFLFVAPLGCLHSSIVVIVQVYHAVFYPTYTLGPPMSVFEVLAAFFCLGLALGTTIAVGALFVVQLKSILHNKTGIEQWICDKADYRLECEHDAITAGLSLEEAGEPPKYAFPYDLGWRRNAALVLNWRGVAIGNGLDDWQLRPGCGIYDFTSEQVKQKQHKASTALRVSIVLDYSGGVFPLGFGLRVACCQPYSACIDESRLAVSSGQRAVVTRMQGQWLYGQLIGEGCRRGWFPRKCALESWEDGEGEGDLPSNGDADKKVK